LLNGQRLDPHLSHVRAMAKTADADTESSSPLARSARMTQARARTRTPSDKASTSSSAHAQERCMRSRKWRWRANACQLALPRCDCPPHGAIAARGPPQATGAARARLYRRGDARDPGCRASISLKRKRPRRSLRPSSSWLDLTVQTPAGDRRKIAN
jgi:hypothetical protein